MAAGPVNIAISNYTQLMNDIKSMNAKSKKVVSRTIGDYKTRAPGWISQEVVKEYNIKKKDVNAARSIRKGESTIKVAGTKVDNVGIHYKSGLLTPTHFGMRPTVRPQKPGYMVSAQIKRASGRKPLGHKVFLAAAGNGGTKHIPFQRKGSDRLPVEVIKTLSIPQMVTNETVATEIHKRINDELGKRLEHNMQQIMK